MPIRPTPITSDLAMVLGGGGARGAYQVGLLRGIARHYPHLKIPILVGVSAGAVNTTHLASHRGSFEQAMEALVKHWLSMTPDQVFRVDASSLASNVLRTGFRLVAGGRAHPDQFRGMVDTAPLRTFLEGVLERGHDGTLPGIEHNLERGSLQALALSATSYTTTQSVTWVQGREISLWERPQRRSEHARITIDHVMASTALPLLFPAAQVGNEWYGDGGIRLTAPLSPALHLGASRIITISTRYDRTRAEANTPQVAGYPPPAQVLGVLYNSIFLDLIDQDVMRMERLNRLIERVPMDRRDDLRFIDMLVLRPSIDLGKLAREYEPRLPRVFRFLTRGLGTRRTESPDILSLVMFQEDFLRRLIDLGEADADAQWHRISRFIEESPDNSTEEFPR
ncbi:MAG: patatin-like phospholipase family protein [Cytophagaceae bacterium]|nr:patatin-like phospholipase family protein [Gemmatimonadaceae bacterium]